MRKIICIGECSLDIICDANGSPVGSMPGGRIVTAAAALARFGLPVTMVSETAADPVGDRIVDFLAERTVNVDYIDRFTEGNTPLMIYFNAADGTSRTVRYERYPAECFDVVWPRIDPDDIVVFGGYYAIDERMRQNQMQLIAHASERKATIIYLPGFNPVGTPRITHLMPAILDNLDLADVVVTRSHDLTSIFGKPSPESCYHDHIEFYCRSLVNVDPDSRTVTFFSGKNSSTAAIEADAPVRSMVWNAAFVAGITRFAFSLSDEDLARFQSPFENFRNALLKSALDTTAEICASITEPWMRDH